jgi:Flp pilus assembly pilin Flp
MLSAPCTDALARWSDPTRGRPLTAGSFIGLSSGRDRADIISVASCTDRNPDAVKRGMEMRRFPTRHEQDESGQGLMEYALVLSLVSIAALGVMSTLGMTIVSSLYDLVNKTMK